MTAVSRTHKNTRSPKTKRPTRAVTRRGALKPTDRRLQSVVESTEDFVAVAAPDGRILYINAGGRRLAGLDESAPLDLHIADLHPERVRDLLMTEALPAAASHGIWSGESTLLARDGREIPISQIVRAHRSSKGAVEFFSTVIRKLRDRQQNDRELRSAHDAMTARAHAAEEQLRFVLGHAPAVLYTSGLAPEFAVKFVSDNARRLFGLDPRALVADPVFWRSHVHPQDWPRRCAELATLAARGTLTLEYRLRDGAGVYRWVRDEMQLVRSPSGEALEVVGSVHDLSELKTAEARVRRALTIETALRDIDSGILSSASVTTTLNRICQAIVELGYELCLIFVAEPGGVARPIANSGPRDLIEGFTFRWDDSPEGSGPTGLAIRTGEVQVVPAIATLAAYAPWRERALAAGARSCVALPLKSQTAGVQGCATVFSRDEGSPSAERLLELETFTQQCAMAIVSARRLEELEGAHARLELSIERMPLARIVWDEMLRVVEWNPAAERIFGYAAAEARGRSAFDLITPSTAQSQIAAVWARLRDESESSYWVNENRRKDGTKLTCEWFNTPLRDGAGRFAGVLSMAHDATEKERLERQLRTAQRMEAVGTLAGGVAHDFNNALTGIICYAEILRERLASNSEAQTDLEQILSSANRASTLTRQLLTFARRQAMDPVSLNLNDVVTDLIKLLRKVIGEHIEIRAHLADDLPSLRADRGQLEQVVMNLSVNARDAMPEGGLLIIETEAVDVDEAYVAEHPYMRPGRFVVLSVTDTGTGMDEETRERAFEPFFTTKGPEKGTGLGLAMVYGIVKQHDGSIHLHSEPGRGTTFKLYFPALEATTNDGVSAQDEPVGGGDEAILIAEDDPGVRDLVQRCLGTLGYDVIVAEDGEQALQSFAARDDVALVVLDWVMPKRSGKEIYERMRTERPATKFLFMSGYSEASIQEPLPDDGGVSFLPKPFGPSVLARKVRVLLDARADDPPAG